MKNFCEHFVSKYITKQTDELHTRNGKCSSKMSRNTVPVIKHAQILQHFVVSKMPAETLSSYQRYHSLQ